MTLGTIYVVFAAHNFVGQFEGFLITLGVPIAAWCGVMLADIALRRRDYAEPELFTPSGRYGDIRWLPVLAVIVSTGIGWGLVTNSSASWLTWQGYLLSPFRLGGKTGAWAFANLGVLVALAIGFIATGLFSRPPCGPRRRCRSRRPRPRRRRCPRHERRRACELQVIRPAQAFFCRIWTLTLAAWGCPRQAGTRWSARRRLGPAPQAPPPSPQRLMLWLLTVVTTVALGVIYMFVKDIAKTPTVAGRPRCPPRRDAQQRHRGRAPGTPHEHPARQPARG